VISGLFLFYLFRLSAFERIGEAFNQVQLIYLLGFFVLYYVSTLIQTFRWKYLLNAWDSNIRFGILFRWIMIGLFLNNFFPGSLGGDAFRIISGKRETRRMDIVAATVFYERILGFGSLVVMGLVALALRGDYLHDRLFWFLLWGLFLALTTVVVISNVSLFGNYANKIIKRYSFLQKLKLDNWLDSFRFQITSPRLLAGVFFLSFLIQGVDILSFRLIASAIQIPVSISDLLLFVPLLYLAILLPLSVNGIGIRETVFVIFSSQWGINSSGAVAFSLTVFALGIAGSLIGGPLYWMSRKETMHESDNIANQDFSTPG